ncbi:MAG: hypothetical protein IT165_16565 [Bryobacterales bacterium]|nr:hypothetical protein [Bryobacterales bacterium]
MPDEIVEPHSDYAPPEPKEENPGKVRVVFIPWEQGSPEAKEWTQKSEQWNHVKEDKYEIVYYQPGASSDALKRVSADPNGSVYIRGHGSAGALALVTKVGDDQISLPLDDVCGRLAEMGLDPKFAGSIKFHSCHSATVFKPEVLEPKQRDLQKWLDATRTAQQQSVADQKQRNQATQAKINELDTGWLSRQWNSAEIAKNQEKLSKGQAALQKMVDQQDSPAQREYIRQKELKMPTSTSIAKRGADILRDKGYTQCTYFGYLGPVEAEYGSLDNNPSKPSDWHKFVDLTPLHEPSEALQREVARGGYNPGRVRASVARVRIR